MKGRLVWSVAVAAAAGVSASHAWANKRDLADQVYIYPGTEVALPTNARIVLDARSVAVGDFRAGVSLDSHRSELRSARERIILHPIATENRGDSTITVLAADQPLQGATSYQLVFDPPIAGLPQHAWTTTASADRQPPRWLSRPTTDPPVVQQTNGGNGAFVDIDVAVTEPALFRVEVRARAKRRSYHALLVSRGRRIRLPVAPGGHYALKLTAIDFAGNEAQAPGPPIEVAVPSREASKR